MWLRTAIVGFLTEILITALQELLAWEVGTIGEELLIS
jgi:hypothetical protein